MGLGVRGVRVHNDIDNMKTDGEHGGWSWKLRAETLILSHYQGVERANSSDTGL